MQQTVIQWIGGGNGYAVVALEWIFFGLGQVAFNCCNSTPLAFCYFSQTFQKPIYVSCVAGLKK